MIARFVNSLPTGISQGIIRFYFHVALRNQTGFHSAPKCINTSNMDVTVLPALQDNYMYLIVDKATNEAAIVDPVDPGSVLRTVQQKGVNLTTVLTTHHHWDHAGGNEQLSQMVKGLKIYGGDSRIGALTDQVHHDYRFKLGNLQVQCLFTPCHTTGHICYFVSSPQEGTDPVVFTGDTLFLGGCGRFFEGNAEQMYRALIDILGNLPDHTKVYCGHEYSIQNLKFAQAVEPKNEDIKKKLDWSHEQRNMLLPTVPSTIGEEKMYNPFMRVNLPSVMQHASQSDPIKTMKHIRLEKDHFKV